ncbi:3-oxoacyl-ACP synthase [Proteiniphilum sp. X52]|nr:3-oxoacyl-ACP synthase [Proteiniphilum sp. X52]
MKKDVYINRTSSYLPNEPMYNEEMEDFLGKVSGKSSRARSIILRQNGIKSRYYALNKQQEITHTGSVTLSVSPV